MDFCWVYNFLNTHVKMINLGMPFTVLGGIIVNIALCDHIHMWTVQFGLNVFKFIWHLRTLILISRTIPWQLYQFIWRHLNVIVLIRVILLTIINRYKKGQRPICYNLFLVLMSAWKRKTSWLNSPFLCSHSGARM